MNRLIEAVLMRAARPYFAGTRLEDAIALAREAGARGYPVTLCYWNAPADPAEQVVEHYDGVIDAIAKNGLDAHMAIKVPPVVNRPELISAVIEKARSHAVAVDIDAHAPDEAEADYEVAARAGSEGMGIAIPGRWKNSPDLADRAVELGLRVRVVKGQWEDPADPDIDLAEGYLRVIDRLAGRCREVGVATHDTALASEAIRRLTAAGTRVEQELLFGLPMNPCADIARDAGLKTRIYIAYGDAWIPYSIKSAFRHPRTLLRFATDLATGHRDGLPKPA